MEKVYLDVSINMDAFAVSIVDSLRDDEKVFELIKTLDLVVGEWFFTARLRDYFNSEMEKEDDRLADRDLEIDE